MSPAAHSPIPTTRRARRWPQLRPPELGPLRVAAKGRATYRPCCGSLLEGLDSGRIKRLSPGRAIGVSEQMKEAAN